jgi:hypothetical protein
LVERDARVLPDHPLNKHVERIEQCGNRVVVTSEGVIHDMRVDGTLENGVNDVAGRPNYDQRIKVAAVFNQGRLDLHPFGRDPKRPPLVTREVINGELIWHYGRSRSRCGEWTTRVPPRANRVEPVFLAGWLNQTKFRGRLADSQRGRGWPISNKVATVGPVVIDVDSPQDFPNCQQRGVGEALTNG